MSQYKQTKINSTFTDKNRPTFYLKNTRLCFLQTFSQIELSSENKKKQILKTVGERLLGNLNTIKRLHLEDFEDQLAKVLARNGKAKYLRKLILQQIHTLRKTNPKKRVFNKTKSKNLYQKKKNVKLKNSSTVFPKKSIKALYRLPAFKEHWLIFHIFYHVYRPLVGIRDRKRGRYSNFVPILLNPSNGIKTVYLWFAKSTGKTKNDVSKKNRRSISLSRRLTKAFKNIMNKKGILNQEWRKLKKIITLNRYNKDFRWKLKSTEYDSGSY